MKPIEYSGKHTYQLTCCECGAVFGTDTRRMIFCRAECRTAHTNRRNQRGLILYDFFMQLLYRRANAKGIWSAMCRIAEEWREEDKEEREGRPSWKDPGEYLEKRPYLIGKRGRI